MLRLIHHRSHLVTRENSCLHSGSAGLPNHSRKKEKPASVDQLSEPAARRSESRTCVPGDSTNIELTNS
ncbi:MAG: hypothetical protein ACK561_16510, partial [Pseudomonadaceae bacterium]